MPQVIVGFLLIALTALIVVSCNEERKWHEWAAENCKVIGEISGSSSTAMGFGTNGSVSIVPVYTPGKTGYQCNNGMQYWR